MTDTETNLMLAVAGHPGDDTPRLVMADYYEETGRPERADFVRKHVELAGTPPRTRGRGKLVRETFVAARRMAVIEEDFAGLLKARWWADNPKFGDGPALIFNVPAGGRSRADRPYSLIVTRGFVTAYYSLMGNNLPNGLAVEMFRRHPIQWTDGIGWPSCTYTGKSYLFTCFFDDDKKHESASFPRGLREFLVSGYEADRHTRVYYSLDQANQDLEQATIRYGRHLAFPDLFPQPSSRRKGNRAPKVPG